MLYGKNHCNNRGMGQFECTARPDLEASAAGSKESGVSVGAAVVSPVPSPASFSSGSCSVCASWVRAPSSRGCWSPRGAESSRGCWSPRGAEKLAGGRGWSSRGSLWLLLLAPPRSRGELSRSAPWERLRLDLDLRGVLSGQPGTGATVHTSEALEDTDIWVESAIWLQLVARLAPAGRGRRRRHTHTHAHTHTNTHTHTHTNA